MAETERPEVKLTKGSTKREHLEDKMIEYINLTKKAEVDLRKDDFISLQVKAITESVRESLGKRQAYAHLHEMQGVVYWCSNWKNPLLKKILPFTGAESLCLEISNSEGGAQKNGYYQDVP